MERSLPRRRCATSGAASARIGDFTDRFAGSADLYERDGRRPFASINFVTAHDGFTLADLVSYNDKHNEANLEDNRDGTDDNRSWNCGVEGPSDDPEVNALRARQQRNFIATLLLSQGVPMLLGGDEIGRTQHGNNNAYCQDNEISWYDWNVDGDGEALLEFTRRMIELRAEHPVFRRTTFFAGDTDEGGLPDVFWFRPDGRRMTRRELGLDRRWPARRVPQRRRPAHRDALRRAAPRRLVPRDLQRATTRTRSSCCPPGASGVAGGSRCRPRSRTGPSRRLAPRAWSCTVEARSLLVLRRVR